MSQEARVDLDKSVGYAIKRSQNALRAAMDGELRRHGLSVPQYSCLEILKRQPEISNAELARSAFVSRQAMHELLAGLERAGLVAGTGEGRHERFAPTAAGARSLAGASRAVAAIEERMLAGLSSARRDRLRADLSVCAEALAPVNKPGSRGRSSSTDGGV